MRAIRPPGRSLPPSAVLFNWKGSPVAETTQEFVPLRCDLAPSSPSSAQPDGWAVVGLGVEYERRFTKLRWRLTLGASERSAASRGWRLDLAGRCTIRRGCPLTTRDRRRAEPNVPALDCRTRRHEPYTNSQYRQNSARA